MTGSRILAQIFCITIATCLLSSGTGAVSAQEPPAEARLGLSVRDERALIGAPVFLTVRLRNQGAMRQARQAAALRRAEGASADSEDNEAAPTIAEPVTQTLAVSGDWRERITFEIDNGVAMDALEPALLTTAEHTPAELGLVPLQATWAIPPTQTGSMAAGTYTVTARLDPVSLFPGMDFPPDRTEPTATAVLSLEAAADSESQAILEETTALYYMQTEDYSSALARALEAIRLDRQRYYAYGYAAQCELALGDTGEAIRRLESLLDVMPPTQDGGEYTVAAQAWLDELTQR